MPIILKKRSFGISRHDALGVLALPSKVVGNAHVTDRLAFVLSFLERNGQTQQTVGCSNVATVATTIFLIIFTLLYPDFGSS